MNLVQLIESMLKNDALMTWATVYKDSIIAAILCTEHGDPQKAPDTNAQGLLSEHLLTFLLKPTSFTWLHLAEMTLADGEKEELDKKDDRRWKKRQFRKEEDLKVLSDWIEKKLEEKSFLEWFSWDTIRNASNANHRKEKWLRIQLTKE